VGEGGCEEEERDCKDCEEGENWKDCREGEKGTGIVRRVIGRGEMEGD